MFPVSLSYAGINLASTQFGAQEMCKGPGLKMLMRRALNTGDPLLLKMLRNISLHSGAIKKPFLVCYYGQITHITVSTESTMGAL